MKSLKVKIKLNTNQQLILDTLSNEHRLLYNQLLNHLKNNSLNFKELNEEYKNYRHLNKLTINSKSSQNTCISLINSVKSYLMLKKKDKTAKFPYKFKSWKYFTTFMLDYNNGNGGFKIENNLLTVNLLSCSENAKKLIIKLPDICNIINNKNIKTIIFKKDRNDYYLCFTHSTPIVDRNLNDNFLSIDPGVKNIATGFSNIGVYFKMRNKTFKSLEKSVSQVQSILDVKQKNSNKYKKIKKTFNKINKKLSDSNKDFQHKLSKSIIDYCINNDITKIIVGDIETKNLVKSVEKMDIKRKSKKGLNRSEQNRGTLSRFLTFIEYKSINEGMDFYRQEESYTSKTNCLTGEIMNNMTLSTRKIKLLDDLTIDRDLNGSINIAQKAKVTWFDQIDLEKYLRKINRMYLIY